MEESDMRFNVMALGATFALFWGGVIFLTAAANLIWPPYGLVFLEAISSIYPGYHPGSGARSVITAALYGVVDGAIGGLVFAWIYNLVVSRVGKST
jgi:hypothetical protein